MYATNFFEEKVLNTFRGIAFTAPAAVYLGLYIESPGEGGQGTEITYPGYRRQPITFSEPGISVADYGNGAVGVKSVGKIQFPAPDQDVGTATHIGILDSETGGSVYLYGKMIDDLKIETGQAPQVLDGDIRYSIVGNFSTEFKKKVLNLLRQKTLAGFEPHLALFNGDPENGGAELSGANYARAKVVFGGPAEAESGQMVIQNSEVAEFNVPTTTWGTWAYTAYCLGASGGELVSYTQRDSPQVIRRGYAPFSDPGQLRVAFN